MRLARHHRHLLLALIAVVPVLFFQSDTSAQLSTSTAQCCLQTTSALHSFLNPAVGEDMRFFSSDARPASIVMTMMDRREMLNFPMSLYEVRERRPKQNDTDTGVGDPDAAEATGCSNPILLGLDYFYPRATALSGHYVSTRTYPAPEYTYSGLNQSNFSNHFNPAKFYRHMTWTAKCQNNNDCAPIDTAATACNNMGLTDAQKLTCASCLADRGFYLNPNIDTRTQLQKALYDPTAAVFSGNWLNFYPPRYVLLRLAMKRLTSNPAISRFRIGVVTSDAGGDGAKVVEALRPSCDGQGTPSTSIANGADDLTFTYSSNPIAETLMNVGQYVSRKDRYKQLIAESTYAMKSTMDERNGNSRSICRDCDKMYVVLFSDGRGDEGNPYCTKDANGALPAPCLAEAKCTDVKLGSENDGDKYVDPTKVGEVYYLGPSKAPGPETPTNTCSADVADDVAGWLYRTDLNPDVGYPARNNITTYVVGVGSARYNKMAALQAIATKGKGTFVAATNYEALENALNDVLEDISSRSTSFSSASVSPLQVSNGASAFLPRFEPSNSSSWTGHLYRWGLFNEWVEDSDKNGDGDKEDVFLVDDTADKHIVVEDSDGNFVLQSDNTQAATSFWEAGKLLKDRGSADRKIWTVTDNASPINQFDRADQLVEFTVANVATIMPYLGLTGTGVCDQLSTKLGLTTPLTEVECAKKIIKYVRGVDVLDEDGDGDTTEDRASLLGDIFHSSPALVDPPPDKFACELGLSTQCARTLYSQDLQTTPTPLVQYDAADGSKIDAYDKYRSEWKTRPRLILVGANDGMVHAFHAGAALDPAPVPTVENPFPDTHDSGTGQEQWAFIPPDLLPKLKDMLSKHNYYVDGDPMVREVWKDSTSTGTANKKDADEFMTLAVFSERRGGTHYFALDVTDTAQQRPTAFAWLFPQPCTDEATEVGETWMTLSPRPPPIGPVLFKKDGGIERTFPSGKIATEERWLVFLQGGYDPNHNLGQGVYALDAVSGKLVYKNTFKSDNNTSKYMKYPFAAPIAAVDFGAGTTTQSVQDGFFDTAIAADTGGQIHVIRFFEPAETDTNGRVTNWYMARTFENDAAEGVDDTGETTTSDPAFGVRKRHPFFFLPAATVQADTGALRVFTGSGDRYNLRDTGAGVCRSDNPAACAKYGCDWQSDLELNANGQRITTHMHYDDFQVKHFRRNVQTGTSVTCTSFSARQTNQLTQCPGNLSPGAIKDRQMICSSALGAYSCSTPNLVLNKDAQTNSNFSTTGLGINRYYGIWAYGGIGPASSTRRLRFKDATTASQFDGTRLRDSSLINVTNVTADAQGTITSTAQPAGPSDPGWFFEYAELGERTASGSALLAGCTLWNSMKYVGTTNTCAIGGDNEARLFQGHYITGAPTCAAAFGGERARTRNVLTPPPELAATTSISKNGQIGQTVQSFDPGAPQATSARVSTVEDVLQLIYNVEVPRELHDCRHVNGTSCP